MAKYSTEEEVIALANDSIYGLAAGVHSTNGAEVLRIANALDAGSVWCNSYSIVHNQVSLPLSLCV